MRNMEKINLSSQREDLKSMEQLINIISPSTNQYSFLPTGYNGIEIIALIRVATSYPLSRQVWRMFLTQKRQQLANVKKCSEPVNQPINNLLMLCLLSYLFNNQDN